MNRGEIDARGWLITAFEPVRSGLLPQRPPDLTPWGQRPAIQFSGNRYASAFSRHDLPEVCNQFSHLSNGRAQGMPDARCTRGLACNVHKKVRTRAYRAAEAIRHPLRNGFTAYSALTPAIGLSCHRHQRKLVSANLTPASRRQDHTTSPSASAPFVKGASASTASRSNVRDDGRRPSDGAGRGRF